MRIAVPTNDMVTISSHFGRTKGFMVYKVIDNKIHFDQYKINTFTRHAKGDHEEHGEHNHNHDGIFKAIGNYQIVIAAGMGKHLYEEFNQKNIQVFVTEQKNIISALDLYIKGELTSNTEKLCAH